MPSAWISARLTRAGSGLRRPLQRRQIQCHQPPHRPEIPGKDLQNPGRTQLINFFSLDDERRLVDLPGYGYAKVAKSKRNEWQEHLDHYLAERQVLVGLVLMMDIRHPLKDFDLMMLEWAAQANMPIHILMTKADKLKFGAAKSTLLKVQSQLKGHPAPLSLQLFSATNGTGCDDAWEKLGEWLEIGSDADRETSGD